MATNNYFNHNDKSNVDSDVYEDLVIESIQMYGLDVGYIARDIVEEDDLLNEEVLSRFQDTFNIEMYPTTIDGFGGEDLLSKFGLQVNDEVTLVVSKRRFETEITNRLPDIDKPKEGDLIYYPPSGVLFEIRFVEDEVPFYQLNQLNVYQLQCELFTYEGQDMDTGIEDIDKIEEMYSVVEEINVAHTGTKFKYLEEVQISVDGELIATAEVVNTQDATTHWVFELTHLTYPSGEYRPLSAGMVLTGVETGATATITEVIDTKDNQDFGDNDFYDDEVKDIVEFDFENPFGDM